MIKKIALLIFISLTKFSVCQCSVQISVNSIDCVSDGNNSLLANPIGLAPFLYVWSNGDTTSIADTLNYNDTISVTMLDYAGCIASATEITPSPPSYTSLTVTNTSCFSCCDGYTSFTPVNNSQLCNITNYYWFPNDVYTTTPNLSGLCASNYTVIINTDCFCSGAFTFNVPFSSVGLVNDETLYEEKGIYPNPSSGEINFQNIEVQSNDEIVVYSLTGELLICNKLEGENRIITSLDNGAYWVEVIRNRKTIFHQRFFIIR